MDFILLDIKNFLKKLENGQLEIEAGQWELHKDLINMKFAMKELKNLKEDVEKMRLSNIQQMNLIKAVQEEIKIFKQDGLENRPVTVSESSVNYEKVYKRRPNRQSSPKGYKKRKNRIIRSEEILEITSQVSNEKLESEQENLSSKAEECGPNSKSEGNFESNSIQLLQRKPSHTKPSQSKFNSQYSHLTNNDILQRYLEDSAKYVDKKKSKETELTYMSSKQNSSENNESRSENQIHESEHTPFWDEYGSRDLLDSVYENRNSAKKKISSETVEEEPALLPKRLVCPNRPRKFDRLCNKTGFVRRSKNHRRAKVVLYCKICGKGFCGKGRLKEHKAMHQTPSLDSTGFKCSYCNQICSTPEKLTSHLRECRIIMRHHFKRK